MDLAPALLLALFAVNAIASIAVAFVRGSTSTQRKRQWALIWCVPVFGATASMVFAMIETANAQRARGEVAADHHGDEPGFVPIGGLDSCPADAYGGGSGHYAGDGCGGGDGGGDGGGGGGGGD